MAARTDELGDVRAQLADAEAAVQQMTSRLASPRSSARRDAAKPPDARWPQAHPPPELTAFLRGIKLPHLDVRLAALGYDDVDDFSTFDEAARERLRAALEKDGVPGGHVDKVVRAVAEGLAAQAPRSER